MAKYALLSNGKVSDLVVADTEALVGPLASLYDVVDVTILDPQPSIGWTFEGGVWFPPKLTVDAKALWTANGFTPAAGDIIIEAEEVTSKSKK
jgi:hypothetical protein